MNAHVDAALLDETDRTRLIASGQLDQDGRSGLGQFLTPSATARLLAGMFDALPARIRLLDAGAGSGSLTAAFIAEACARTARPAHITALAAELDPVLIRHLHRTLERCSTICSQSRTAFLPSILPGDFIEAAVRHLDGGWLGGADLACNAVILNPPYCKIGSTGRERRLLRSIGLDATNLYAAFTALAIRLLEPGGQLVAIIPRSFCNGPYFRPFRSLLLDEMSLRRIHSFTARDRAFSDDSVLQENVIIHAVKDRRPASHIVVSSSASAEDRISSRRLAMDEVVREANGDRFIHLPTEADDSGIAQWIAEQPDTLSSLGLTVSTGRVVDFRARDHLCRQPTAGSMPLIYPCHFSTGVVRWPRSDQRKPNALAWNDDTASLFVPSGHYTLTKRFSSKEERRRLVAAVFDPGLVDAPHIGFENHMNYVHRQGRGLDPALAYGLSAYLNGAAIDRYFRAFNGHTQVNATDLRSLRYPAHDTLLELGCWFRDNLDASAEDIDVRLGALTP